MAGVSPKDSGNSTHTPLVFVTAYIRCFVARLHEANSKETRKTRVQPSSMPLPKKKIVRRGRCLESQSLSRKFFFAWFYVASFPSLGYLHWVPKLPKPKIAGNGAIVGTGCTIPRRNPVGSKDSFFCISCHLGGGTLGVWDPHQL